MNHAIKYWKEKETDSREFIKHFRCTTEPIGGCTEYNHKGELVDYEAAVVAIGLEKKNIIHKAIEWLEQQDEIIGISSKDGAISVSLKEDFIKKFRKAVKQNSYDTKQYERARQICRGLEDVKKCISGASGDMRYNGIIIKTKYRVGDKVWFMHKKRVVCECIKGLHVSYGKGDFYGMLPTGDEIFNVEYLIRNDSLTVSEIVREENLFSTKEELLKSL